MRLTVDRLVKALGMCTKMSKTRMRTLGGEPSCIIDYWMQDTLREIKEAKLSGDMPQPFSTDTEISGYLFDFLFAVQEASTSLLLWTVALLELHAELLAKVREMTLRRWHVRW